MNTIALLVTGALTGLVALVDKVPSEDEIGAGWGAVALFVLLASAVAFLGFSLSKHLRKARTNAEHGAFGKNGTQP
jgi:hypothetical protein